MAEKKITGVKSVTLGDVRAVEQKAGLKPATSQALKAEGADDGGTIDRKLERVIKKWEKKMEKPPKTDDVGIGKQLLG